MTNGHLVEVEETRDLKIKAGFLVMRGLLKEGEEQVQFGASFLGLAISECTDTQQGFEIVVDKLSKQLKDGYNKIHRKKEPNNNKKKYENEFNFLEGVK